MAYKVLGRKAAAATTAEELYATPSSSAAVVSSIVVANRSATARTYRLAVKPATGTTLANEHYIAYDVTIAANDSVALTLGITLAAGNVIVTYASAADLTFTAFGSELAA
jgi:IMP cyclohydrolase